MNKLQVIENLATVNQSSFTITDGGKAYISQRKASDLIGIPQSTISDWIKKNSVDLNLNEKNQLDPKSFQKLVILGQNRNIPQAIELLDKILESGAKAFIFNQAGYQIKAVLPPSRIELARENLILLEELEVTTNQRDTAIRTKAHISDKKTATALGRLGGLTKEKNRLHDTVHHDDDWYAMARVRAIHPDGKFCWQHLIKGCNALKLPPRVTTHINHPSVNIYHRDVWHKVYDIEEL